MYPNFTGRARACLGTASLVVSLVACGSSKSGGPASGPADSHCGSTVQAVNEANCNVPPPDGGADAIDYGATMYGSEGDDDDCKYHVSWTSTDIQENQDVTFTVKATEKASGQPATGANIDAEVFLNDTHPAPNSGQATQEGQGGSYTVGPVRFDAPGRWTVRFHLHEDCTDTTEDSPHGHAAFYVDVP